jgi:hypothetical protein
MSLEEGLHRLGVVESTIVADQTDSPAHVGCQKRRQEHDKLGTAFCRRHGVGQASRFVIDAAIDHLLFVLAGCRNLRLFSPRSPGPSQRGMPVDFDLILINQDFASILPQGFFLRTSSSRRARR